MKPPSASNAACFTRHQRVEFSLMMGRWSRPETPMGRRLTMKYDYELQVRYDENDARAFEKYWLFTEPPTPLAQARAIAVNRNALTARPWTDADPAALRAASD